MSLHLVTGGSGFVGNALVQTLLEQGHHVRVVDIQPPAAPHPNLEYYRGSILNEDLLQHTFKNVEVVHHAAAMVPLVQSPTAIEKININGTQAVLSAARHAGVRHFNFLSSSAVYGETTKANCPLSEDSPTVPFEVYGKSKLRAEQCVQSQMIEASTLSYTILRPRTIIGPGRLGIFDLLFNWIQTGRTIYLIGDGSNLLQLIHVQDFVQACILAAQKRQRGVFNIGSNQFGSLRDSIMKLCEHAGSTSRIQAIPVSIAVPSLLMLNKLHLSPFGAWHYRTFHRDYYFNTSKAERELGWSSQHSNDAMLIEAYDWFVKNQNTTLNSGSIHQRSLKRGILSLFMGSTR